jgi:STE24 endopeptidase
LSPGAGKTPQYRNTVSRILLLLIFLLWMAWTPKTPVGVAGAAQAAAGVQPHGTAGSIPAWMAADPRLGLATFFGFYVILLGVTRLWSRVLARRVTSANLDRSLRRFGKFMLAARFMVPAWFGVGLFVLGWGRFILPFEHYWAGFQLPGLLIGTFPAFVAWTGLWWSQFPAEHALREHNLLDQLETGLPVYAPPTFREYFTANLRLQVLFTIVPVLAIVFLRDVLSVALRPLAGTAVSETVEFVTMLLSTALVFLLAPELLRRVLQTQSLPDSPLRRRLERLCQRVGMRYRDILLWRTQNNMGNAAVMGILPPVRYILLSDLLLERMDDEQIEAVFAHEVGHVVHRHMAWYVVIIMIFSLGLMAVEQLVRQLGPTPAVLRGVPQELVDVLSVVASLVAFLVFFGFLSRRFERQADVYAARTMEATKSASAPTALAVAPEVQPAAEAVVAPLAADVAPFTEASQSHVGPYGATVFSSALHRVAVMNNIPLTPRRRPRRGLLRRIGHSIDSFAEATANWFHGSVPHRMAYLRRLAADPSLTRRFDSFMLRLYCTLLFALFASAAFVVASGALFAKQ